MFRRCCWISLFVIALAAGLQAQTSAKHTAHSDKEKLIGAWHLVRIDMSGSDGKPSVGIQPKGMLIYTKDGQMSVQLMYPNAARRLTNEYVQQGYEASFGSYDLNEAKHTVTHHVRGSVTRDLIGKELERSYQFTREGQLVIKSTRSEEHWSVTWEHY